MMLLWTVLCSSLLVGASAYEPDTFKVLVDLLNGLFIDSALSFEYEFGSGVPLLQGKATVTLQPPLQLLPNSTVSYPDNYTQLCSLNLQVERNITITQENSPGLDLILGGCHIELDVAVSNRTDWQIKPVFVWVDDCDIMEFSNGFQPPVPEQVLPTLSQGMLNVAVELFSKEYDEAEDIKTDPSQSLKVLQDIFPVLMYLKGRPIVFQGSGQGLIKLATPAEEETAAAAESGTQDTLPIITTSLLVVLVVMSAMVFYSFKKFCFIHKKNVNSNDA